MMRDFIIQDQTQKSRECFIASIDQENVRRLASSHHANDDCKIFGSRNGGFNVCFFLEFVSVPESDQVDRWVVRIPIPSRVHWVEEKLEVEIATMKYVETHTSIPVPKIRAYSFSRDNHINMPYIIMDYVDGYTLKELGFPIDDIWQHTALKLNESTEHVYTQLADVYLQLRQQEFSAIGALGLPKHSQSTIQVCHRPISVEIILQTDEGLNPTERFREGTCFTRTRDYADALLWLADNELVKGRNPGIDVRDGRKTLYAIDRFKKFVKEAWLDPRFENGPFVLMHGDMSIDNLLWDKNLRLCAVLDWEWSHVVPLRFLAPPIWLMGGNAATLSRRQYFYNFEAGLFRALLRDREKAISACSPLLSEQWADIDKICHPLIVSALFRPEYIFEVYWNYLADKELSGRRFQPKDIKHYNELVSTKLEAFMDSSRVTFLERKAQDQARYLQDEKVHFHE